MADWKHNLDVSDLWRQGKERTISAKEMGAELSKRLGTVPTDSYLETLRREFENLPSDATFDDFDDVLEKLYSWADDGHKLWLQTFSIEEI